MERRIPTQEEVTQWIHHDNNWGRWGKDDERGTTNLITPAKRAAAARLVRSGRSVSLARHLAVDPAPGNPRPADHGMHFMNLPGGYVNAVADYIGVDFHGAATTHLDALCHYWGRIGVWNNRKPEDILNLRGSTFAAVDVWGDGIVTRGVLLDIPRHRKAPYVATDKPVHAWEMEDAAKAQGVTIEPGDALVVYSGREAWQRDHPNDNWGAAQEAPGLHASCLAALKQWDVGMLVWDCMDVRPSGYAYGGVHCGIFAYGLALLDNALLEPLAQACAAERRYEFMLTVAPLKVHGGTGSPVNPIALF